ncbi:MAG TPA: polysaccharide pyruvyl transferase family protein [Trichormus sp. M33_DOE_039]|nr:polysaccharide pyruvyl transferase family protein [Trichormus sp. M33_DOE_039]
MKIAVFGYYHHLNYGDDRLGQALVHALYPHNVVLLPHNQEPPSMEWFDFILIGGGGLVWAKVGIWQQIKTWLKNSKKPFGVVGLGINELNDDMKPDLLWMADNATLFVVRDQKSHQLLDYHPKVRVLPDLTWMIPYSFRTNNPKSETIAVSLASKHPQGYDPIIWGKLIRQIGKTVPFPLRFGVKHDSDIFHKLGYENIHQEFSIAPLYECSYLIGSRFHSIVFALQIGIPFIAVLYDDKVTRLLDDNQLSDLGIGAFEYDQLPLKLNYLKSNINSISSRIESVSNRLRLGGEQLEGLLLNVTQQLNEFKSSRSNNYLMQKIKRYITHLRN